MAYQIGPLSAAPLITFCHRLAVTAGQLLGRMYLLIPATFHSLFPIDFLALTLVALVPLPLGEVEPKRGRGARAIYSSTIRLCLPNRRGLTSPARGQGDDLRGWRHYLYDWE